MKKRIHVNKFSFRLLKSVQSEHDVNLKKYINIHMNHYEVPVW